MKPVFVSYYTHAYRNHAVGLKLTLDRFRLRHDVCFVTDKGSWQANTQRKPAFLRSMLDIHKGPVIWVDADARVRQDPTVLTDMPADVDVAFHSFGLAGGRLEPLSGTVYVANTETAREFLDRWQENIKKNPGRFEQECMGQAAEGAHVRQLPAEYCFIFDIFRKEFYVRNHPEIGEPVIEHLQASREFREPA